jgi:hypothetical protein
MRFVLVALVLGLSLAGTAQAAEEYIDLYPCMDPCCMFSSICVDIECCGWCCETAPMTIQFMDADGNVLGSGVIEDYCNGCYDEHWAELDAEVNSMDVCSIRLITEFDECCMADWASIKVFCDDPCDCGKWKMAWKGDLWCWMPME